jgi:hypothetical protein
MVGGPMLVLTLGAGQATVVALAVNDVMTGPEGGSALGGGAADVAALAGVVIGGPPVVVAAAVVVTARDVVVAFFAAASDDLSSPPHAAITDAHASGRRESLPTSRASKRDVRDARSALLALSLARAARSLPLQHAATAVASGASPPPRCTVCDQDILRYPNHVAIERSPGAA